MGVQMRTCSVVSVADATAVLGKSKSAVYRLIKGNRIGWFRWKRRYWVNYDVIAALVARHDRKSGGDVGDSARGSNAFTGGVDVVLQLALPQGQTRPTIRILNAVSRFSDTPPSLVIERIEIAASPCNGFQAETYVLLGSEGSVATAEAAEALKIDLPTCESEAITMVDFRAAHKHLSRSVLQTAIDRDQAIKRIGIGKKGDPQRFFRPLMILPESESIARQNGSNEDAAGLAA